MKPKSLTQVVTKQMWNASLSRPSKEIYQHVTGCNDDLSSMDNFFIESADIDVTDGDNFVFLKKIHGVNLIYLYPHIFV